MRTRLYTLLGWLSWQGMKTVANRKFGQNRVKLGAAATVAAVVAAGLVAAKVSSVDE
jgi:hypothetical protein